MWHVAAEEGLYLIGKIRSQDNRIAGASQRKICLTSTMAVECLVLMKTARKKKKKKRSGVCHSSGRAIRKPRGEDPLEKEKKGILL